MARRWVVNASPVILLAKIGQIGLLEALTDELIIPLGVVEELQEGPEDDPGRLWVQGNGARWVQDLGEVGALIAAWDLGKGESQVLSWAYQHPEFSAVVDDRAARSWATALGLSILGTLGVLLTAKQEGEVALVAPLFDELKRAGMRIDAPLLERALKLLAASLLKTRSGKIMRRLLRDVAEGRVLGDTTTLADPTVVASLREKYSREESY